MALRKLAVTVCGLLTIAVLLPPAAARADQFSEAVAHSFSSADITAQTPFLVGSLDLFDPSLGTLTSVQLTFVLDPPTSWVGTSDSLRFDVRTGEPALDFIFDLTPGLYLSSITHTHTFSQLDTQNFIGHPPFMAKTAMGVELIPLGSPGTFSSFLVGELMYTFTPAAAVPGPIVGTGLPGLILACSILLVLARRRHQIA
jgi:hypothetical protein